MPTDAGTIYSEVRILIDKLNGDVTKVVDAYKQMGQKLGVESTKTATKAKADFGAINLAGVAAFAGIGIAIKAAVSTFAGFEQSMANVKSVTSATEEEFQALRKAAEDAGETTRFSASQAADALYYLASAGLDATQSTEALNATLMLAGSTGSDLAFTAETMTSALAMYNLEAEEADRVSNVFAATIAASQATMDKLATSFRYVGPVASSFGMSIEQTSAALAILYNNGFEASQAGTALRSALADLANASSPANAKLKELGVSFEEINPQTNSFAEVIDVLSKKVTDGSDVMAVFGDRAGPALIKLLESGRAELDKYEKAVTGTTKASQAYAIQNDTLLGSMDELSSQIESGVIKTMDYLSGTIRGLVDFAAGLMSVFNALPGPVKGAVGIFAVLLSGLVALSVIIPIVSGLMSGLAVTIGALTLTAGPIMLILAGVAALTSGIIGLVTAFQKAEAKQIAKDFKKLGEEFQLTEKQLVSLVKAAKSVGIMAEDFAKLQKETGLATKELKGLIAAGNKIGANAEDVVKLNTEFGLTAKQIKKTGAEINNLQELMTLGYYEAGEGVDIIAEKLKISKEQTAAVVLAQKNVSQELKNQAILIQSNAKAQKTAVEQLVVQEAYLASLKAGNTWAKQKADAEAAAKALKDAEASAKVAQQIADLAQVRIDKETKLQIIKTSLEKNLITEKEAEEAKVKLYNDVANKVLEINNGYDAGNEQLAEALAYLKEHGAILKDNTGTAQEWTDKLKQLDETALEAIERQRDLALEGVVAGSELEKAINDYYDRLADDEANKEFLDNLKSTTDQVKSAFDSLMNSVGDIFETINKNALAGVEERLQAELDANGLAEKSAVEKAQESLDAAISAGDATAENDAKNALLKAQIEEKYAKEKAQLEYDNAMVAWNLRWISAIGDTAAAVVKALPNIPLSITAGVIGAVQTGIILANKPTMPAFETGGIVPGNSFSGDNVLMRGNSGEGVFTQDQMQAMGMMANGGGPTDIKVFVTLGKYSIDDVVVDVVERRSDSQTMRINKAVVR